MSQSDAMEELIQTRAIEQLMVRYADRIDANDPEGAAACFAEDGIGRYWGVYRGRDEIAKRLRGILEGFTATSHHLTNVSIRLNGDRASAVSYVYAFHRLMENGEPLHYWGRWVDQLVRVDGEWLFADREVVGVGSISPGGQASEQAAARPGQGDLDHPGHPGRRPPSSGSV